MDDFILKSSVQKEALKISLQLHAISIHKFRLNPNFISIFILLPVDESMG